MGRCRRIFRRLAGTMADKEEAPKCYVCGKKCESFPQDPRRRTLLPRPMRLTGTFGTSANICSRSACLDKLLTIGDQCRPHPRSSPIYVGQSKQDWEMTRSSSLSDVPA